MRKVLLFLFSHRLLAITRWDAYFIMLRLRNFLTRQNARIARAVSSRGAPLFLNLGSGPRGRADARWINIDGFQDRNVDFLLDIVRPLPLPDAAFAGVFCEHVLEHFSQEDGEKIAREIFRVLSPECRFRVVVPDAETIIRAYCDSPDVLRGKRGGTAAEAVNSYFRQRYEHQFLYDWPTMEQMLRRAGFGTVIRQKCGRGDLPELILDDPKYEWESLYVEAVKPAAAA
ncbi:MAG: methyltransferase domain-containing protein [Alphaproteobacteria bacterium]|nr:methyltransferase domain-containing protein [Alphaproteobacteria bacterium]MDE2493948.1 methyltransferase domain-containing protein [Alphaproteobacteria bacterium]